MYIHEKRCENLEQNVFIIGATGKVGRRLISQIFEKEDTSSLRHSHPTTILGLASSTEYLYSGEGIDEKNAILFSKKRIDGKRYSGIEDILKVLRRSSKSISVIDVTASADMLELHRGIIDGTRHKVVTANKAPLAVCDFDTFQTLTSKTQRYGFRCSVMAGAEAVDKLRDLCDLGDTPVRIEGSFSGTLGFITTELQKGKRFSYAVREAARLGYTEPNPASDLDGSDVARKILILSRTAGFRVNLEDVKITPFVPKGYLLESDPEKFLKSMERLDEGFRKRMESALKRGKTLRYVACADASGDQLRIKAGLESVDLMSPLGQLLGTANKIVIITKTYGKGYYSVEAPGAGIDITAQNIRRDLLYQLEERQVAQPEKK